MSLFSFYFYALFVVVLFLSALTKSKIVLLIASFIFIAFQSWIAAAVLFSVIILTYFCAKRKKKTWQYMGIVSLVILLCFYKFAEKSHLNIIVPLGVSFFTFSAISYLADIARGEYSAADFLHTALYLSFFPKLTSGPLQKASDFFMQLDSERNITRKNLSDGLQIYCFGLFKKIVLADHLSVFVNEVYATPAAFSSASILLALVSYSLQIYFDFSGYSDMAIGAGKMLGFNLPQNFNTPYLAENVTDFWRRWHISLSTWIRNYIYISLGGNRKGKTRQMFNLIFAMTFCGLWHGATINFVLWGFLHGVALAIHKKFRHLCETKRIVLPRSISVLLTFAFVSLLWVPFRATSITDALFIYHRLFLFTTGLNQPYFWSFISIAVFAFSTILIQNRDKAFYPILDFKKISHLTAFFVYLGLLFCLCYTGGSPFIYGAF